MENEESQTTRKVREAILKAANTGKDLSHRVSEITRKAVKEVADKHGSDIKRIEEASRDAATGFIRAVKESGLKMLDLFNDAITGISRGTENLGQKVSAAAKAAAEKTIGAIRETKGGAEELTRDTSKGAVEGIKEINDKKAAKK